LREITREYLLSKVNDESSGHNNVRLILADGLLGSIPGQVIVNVRMIDQFVLPTSSVKGPENQMTGRKSADNEE